MLIRLSQVYGRKLTALVLELPPHYTSSAQLAEDIVEEVAIHDPTDESQEVFAQSQGKKLKFGDDGHLIKASLVDVDCSK